MSAKKRKKIPSPLSSDKKISIVKQQTNLPYTDFSFCSNYPWLSSVNLLKQHGFTNFHFNPQKCVEDMVLIIHEIIPFLHKNNEEIFKSKKKYKHCHLVDENKINICNTIFKMVTNYSPEQTIDASCKWWQIGIKQGVRLIGLYNSNTKTFYPIFVDWHHLLHPSEKHNQLDYRNCKYNPTKKP
ncbi:hypothetical protein [Enterococcus cecorum]|uniref:hypothetical protein n=1 Tax=Enterococcus cecorum TaxID=44008 RepID=UPI000AB67717|nr:hypothetical protein [Enterococcus cecorum]